MSKIFYVFPSFSSVNTSLFVYILKCMFLRDKQEYKLHRLNLNDTPFWRCDYRNIMHHTLSYEYNRFWISSLQTLQIMSACIQRLTDLNLIRVKKRPNEIRIFRDRCNRRAYWPLSKDIGADQRLKHSRIRME